jgi:hypothetical protein
VQEVSIDLQLQIGAELKLQIGVRRNRAPLPFEAPAHPPGPIAGREIADKLDLGLPVEAFHRAHQSAVGDRFVAMLANPALGDRERVADHDPPASVHRPRRLEHVRARLVATRQRHPLAPRPDPQAPRVPVQNRRANALGVEPRQAQPLNRTVRRDERGGLTIGEEAVAADVWEGSVPLHGRRAYFAAVLLPLAP